MKPLPRPQIFARAAEAPKLPMAQLLDHLNAFEPPIKDLELGDAERSLTDARTRRAVAEAELNQLYQRQRAAEDSGGKVSAPPRAEIDAALAAFNAADRDVNRLREEVEAKSEPWRKRFAEKLNREFGPVRQALKNQIDELESAIKVCARMSALAAAHKCGAPWFLRNASNLVAHIEIVRSYLRQAER